MGNIALLCDNKICYKLEPGESSFCINWNDQAAY